MTEVPAWIAYPAALAAMACICCLYGRVKYLQIRQTRLKRQLERALKHAREFAHLQSLGKSTCGLLHDLKNQLAAASGHAMLLSRAKSDENRMVLVERLNGVVSRVETFAQGMFEFSKSVSLPDKHPLRLSEVLRRCVELNFPGHEKKFHFGEIPQNEELFQADACQLDRAFSNLLRNSLEAGAQRVEIRLGVSEGKMSVYIEDDGKGCTLEELEKLTQAFYTTKKNQGGSGLGLCVAQEVIERHCGCLRLFSKNQMADYETGLIQVVQFQTGGETSPLAPPRRKRSREPALPAKLGSMQTSIGNDSNPASILSIVP